MRSEKGITKLKLIIIIFIVVIVLYGVFVISKNNKKEEKGKKKIKLFIEKIIWIMYLYNTN